MSRGIIEYTTRFLIPATTVCLVNAFEPMPVGIHTPLLDPRNSASQLAPQIAPETPPAEDTKMTIKITSTAFKLNEPIPKQYTGDGRDISPPLRWDNIPPETKEIVLIMDDPDAPRKDPWVHWLIYKLPPALRELPEGVARDARLKEPAGALQGNNSWGAPGYRGPAPPKGHGVHHYHFKFYALRTALDVKEGLEKETLLSKMKGHVLAEGELIGTYERK